MSECTYRTSVRNGLCECKFASDATCISLRVDGSRCVEASAGKAAAIGVLSKRIITRSTKSCCGRPDVPLLDSLKALATISPEAAEQALVDAVSAGMSVADALKLAIDAQLKLD